MSHRIAQIESSLIRAVSEVLQRRIADPRIEGLISVTRINVSPDLHHATVYVSVLPESKEKTVVRGLQHATRHIQKLVREAVRLRIVPHLEFRLDEGIKKEANIYHAIQRGLQRTGPDAPESPESSDPSSSSDPDVSDQKQGDPPSPS